MKNKSSITKKLFIITFIVFVAFLSSTLIVQSLFFEKLYIGKKKNDLKVGIEKFKTEYNKAENSEKALSLIEEYEDSYNIKIIIDDKLNKVRLSTVQPKNRTDLYKFRELTDFIKRWNENLKPPDMVEIKPGTTNIIMKKGEMDNRYLIGIIPLNGGEKTIYSISSLQPVNEAVSVIERLYMYFFIGAIFLTTFLALIFSNMIVKPLLKINKAATKMAQLDFTEKCEVNSKDEIGNVAASLNFLSENLDSALSSLKEANAKLEEDIEKERKLEKMRKEFVAAVSHELKTPISLIDGYAIGLKDDIFEGEEKEYYLDIISDEARKMGNLVSDMLDLSHIESGLYNLTKEEFDLTELISFTLRKYEHHIAEKGVALEINLLKRTRIYADFNRMEQVITNFITNALRYVKEQGIIKVSMIDRETSISIEVENTGEHIPQDELSKIWDKFYKIDKSRNRKLGGTGIGLSIVKNILMLHKYPFGVENTEIGVKFYFVIPKRI